MMSIRALALFVSLISGSALLAPACLAVEGSVTIVSPRDGATLNSKNQNKLVYDAIPGPNGDHLHIYLDGKLIAQTRQLKGSFLLTDMNLPLGMHKVCFKMANAAHILTGPQGCVNVNIR